MNTPKVSICIPAYEQPEALRRCMLSITEQTFTNYEIIITDDSFDDCLEQVVNEFNNISNLRYIKNIERKGSPSNWNEAISYATGEYIKILHHDDWFYDRNSLKEFVEMLDENPTAILGFCISRHYSEKLEFISTHIPTNSQLKLLNKNCQVLFFGNFIGAPSATIFRRSELEFDSSLKWVVDIDFYIRILKMGSFAFCNKGLICISVENENRVTSECISNSKVLIPENLYLFEKLDMHPITFQQIWYFLHLFSQCNINSVEDIRKNNYFSTIPKAAKIALKAGKWLFFVVVILHPRRLWLIVDTIFPHDSKRRDVLKKIKYYLISKK